MSMLILLFILIFLIALISYSCLVISSDSDRKTDDLMQERYIREKQSAKKK